MAPNRMIDSMEMLECVAFILVRGDQFLAEKRRADKAVAPGITAIPGGHLDEGEAPEAGVVRELREELGLQATSVRYVCSLLHRSQELQRLHYYAVEAWDGSMENNEAEELLWIPFSKPEQLDLVVDRTAVSEYLRLYRPAGT